MIDGSFLSLLLYSYVVYDPKISNQGQYHYHCFYIEILKKVEGSHFPVVVNQVIVKVESPLIHNSFNF